MSEVHHSASCADKKLKLSLALNTCFTLIEFIVGLLIIGSVKFAGSILKKWKNVKKYRLNIFLALLV